MHYALQTPEAAECLDLLASMLRRELAQDFPDVARLSIALGAVELSLTSKDASKQLWPRDLAATVDRLHAAFAAFAAELAVSAALLAAPSPAAKVKAVADAVWGRLHKGYSKDLQHAQHVYNFAALLPGGVPGVKRQLDCAGVVTTTYALCHALARSQPRHADLAAARMQISEDHCWLQLGADGARETTVEATTDTAAKRGLPVAPDAWAGWLYSGGRATLCTPHQALAALVASLNPGISGGKKGSDSEGVQAAQAALLEVLLAAEPAALYPAALCALADLREVAAQDALDDARGCGDAGEVQRLLQRRPLDAQDLFERAIRLAGGDAAAVPGGGCAAAAPAGSEQRGAVRIDIRADGGVTAVLQPVSQQLAPQEGGQQAQLHAPAAHGGPARAVGGAVHEGSAAGWQWYPHSYLAAFLARRAKFLVGCGEHHAQAAVETFAAALAAAADGGAVLARYRFVPSTDEQLFKDVEGVLEECCCEGLAALAARHPGGQLEDAALLAALLRLWDGVCLLFSGKPKPAGWVAALVKAAKLFTPAAREAAAAATAAASGPMAAARHLWRDLKPAAVKPLFESADVAGGGSGPGERATKRPRR